MQRRQPALEGWRSHCRRASIPSAPQCKPFYRSQTCSFYVQFVSRQINLRPDKGEAYHGWHLSRLRTPNLSSFHIPEVSRTCPSAHCIENDRNQSNDRVGWFHENLLYVKAKGLPAAPHGCKRRNSRNQASSTLGGPSSMVVGVSSTVVKLCEGGMPWHAR
jgi:hypothetical protein